MAHASLAGDEIVLQVTWVEKDRAAQVPGMNYKSRTKMWHGRLSWGTYVTLYGIFGTNLTVDQALGAWATHQVERNSYMLSMREALSFSEDNLSTPEYDHLYPHQKVGARFTSTSDGVLIGDEMGSGKSPQTLVALSLTTNPLPALIVCPNSVKTHWAKEAARWYPEAHTYIIGGGAGERRRTIGEGAEDPAALFIINYEAIRLHSRLAPYGGVRLLRCVRCGGGDDRLTEARCEVHLKELNHLPFKSVIVDEAHRMKDPKSKQTRAVWAVQHGRTVQRRWALTGTPIANDVGDLWSIMHGVAPDDYPTRSKYIDRYALLAWNPHANLDIVGVRPDTKDEFNSILYPRFRRMLKSIVARHLPPKVREVREAPMTAKQAKAYKQMKEEMIAELDDGDQVVASRNLTRSLRLMQFSSAYCQINVEDNKLIMSEPSPKLDVMEEIIAELGGKQVAICAASRQLIEMAAKRLDEATPPISYRLLTGKVPPAQRQINIDEFMRGEVQCMLFTIAAGGVGVNMNSADTIVFLQRSWSMLENKQAEDRVHRMGSERHECVTIVDIVAPGTIEVKQLQRLQEKSMMLEEVVRDREQLMRAGLPTDELDRRELEILSGDLLA